MEAIIISIIGSGALAALISGIFNLVLNRKGRLGHIESDLEKLNEKMKTSEKDALRTQLLLMLSDYSHDVPEILNLARHYFVDLKGDWYLTSIFNHWLEDNNIASPGWFNKDK